MGAHQRNKGIRGEREVIILLQPIVRQVYEANSLQVPKLQRNTLQSDGGGYDITGLPWLALEVKWQQELHLAQWWAQCTRQCGYHQTPILFYKRNHAEWRVMLELMTHAAGDTSHFAATITLADFLRYFRARLIEELRHGT